jgi:hypothetical protein
VTLGASIFLLVVGLILAFAVDVSLSGVSLQVIGLILAAAGLLGLILHFTLWAPGRRTATTRTIVDPAAPRVVEEPGVVGERRVVEERRTYDDGGPQY